jgi:hypothetical protein
MDCIYKEYNSKLEFANNTWTSPWHINPENFNMDSKNSDDFIISSIARHLRQPGSKDDWLAQWFEYSPIAQGVAGSIRAQN